MEQNLIKYNTFYEPCSFTYPPFKNGKYMEEYFFDHMQKNGLTLDKHGRKYIPAFWTNFQVNSSFSNPFIRHNMQMALVQYVQENPSPSGYFVVVQHDDGCLLPLPHNTLVYSGGGTGNIMLPLIYEDVTNTLSRTPKLSFQEKTILCSFVGNDTHKVRTKMTEVLSGLPGFQLGTKKEWTTTVPQDKQTDFIETTRKSKFALAPRGYGRSSFRFYEILKLGTVPIYIWDDIEWLAYKKIVDHSKFSISIHVSQLDQLEERLLAIDETRYMQMLAEYEKIKHVFELDFMCKYILSEV